MLAYTVEFVRSKKLGQTLVDKILSGHLLESMAAARVKTDLLVSYVDHNNE